MKRIYALILVFVMALSLAACGDADSGSEQSVDLNALYAAMEETLPEMIRMEDPDTVLNFFGIRSEDCVQMVTAICADGLRTDEVWLIEAKDAQALERIRTLAENRITAKEDETIVYSPEQYAVVEEAELLVQGNYLALLVNPDVETLKANFLEAVE